VDKGLGAAVFNARKGQGASAEKGVAAECGLLQARPAELAGEGVPGAVAQAGTASPLPVAVDHTPGDSILVPDRSGRDDHIYNGRCAGVPAEPLALTNTMSRAGIRVGTRPYVLRFR